MADPELLITRTGRVLTLTINRPARKNALTGDVFRGLEAALEAAATNPDVGAIVLTGTGDAFSAGGDMSLLSDSQKDAGTSAQNTDTVANAARASLLLAEIPKPTIARVRGVAAGGGFSLAVACDLRIADDSARFAFAYTRIALAGDVGGSIFLTRLVGANRAKEIMFGAPVLDAAEAYRLGLVNWLVPAAELDARCTALANELAAAAPLAIAAIKQNIAAAETLPLREAFRVEAENFVRCRQTEDHKNALRAFAEKRPPQFTGR